MPTENVKQQVALALKHLPDDCTLEDVQYHLYVMETIRRRLSDAQRADFVADEEVEAAFERWMCEKR